MKKHLRDIIIIVLLVISIILTIITLKRQKESLDNTSRIISTLNQWELDQ
jgi:uncharacterized protein YoxC